jgi:hypothetical protein
MLPKLRELPILGNHPSRSNTPTASPLSLGQATNFRGRKRTEEARWRRLQPAVEAGAAPAAAPEHTTASEHASVANGNERCVA